MSWTYEIALRGDPSRSADVQTWLNTAARDCCAGLPGLASLDVYMPALSTFHRRQYALSYDLQATGGIVAGFAARNPGYASERDGP